MTALLRFPIETLKAAFLALAGSLFLVAVLYGFCLPPSEIHGGGGNVMWIDHSFLSALRELLPAYGIAFFATGIAVGYWRRLPAAVVGCTAIGVLYAVHFGADLSGLVSQLNENGPWMSNEARQALDAQVRYSLIAVAEALFLMPLGAMAWVFVRRRFMGQTGEQG